MNLYIKFSVISTEIAPRKWFAMLCLIHMGQFSVLWGITLVAESYFFYFCSGFLDIECTLNKWPEANRLKATGHASSQEDNLLTNIPTAGKLAAYAPYGDVPHIYEFISLYQICPNKKFHTYLSHFLHSAHTESLHRPIFCSSFSAKMEFFVTQPKLNNQVYPKLKNQ